MSIFKDYCVAQILLPALALASICYGQLARYGGGGGGGGGGGPGRTGGGGSGGGGGGDGGGGSLEESIPGVPGVDYPVYAEVPDTGFSCDGRVSYIKIKEPSLKSLLKRVHEYPNF